MFFGNSMHTILVARRKVVRKQKLSWIFWQITLRLIRERLCLSHPWLNDKFTEMYEVHFVIHMHIRGGLYDRLLFEALNV